MTTSSRSCPHSLVVHQAYSDRLPESVASHLHDCDRCALEWRGLHTLSGVAKGHREVRLSSDEKDAIRASLLAGARAIAKESRPRKAGHRRLVGAGGLILVAAAAALTLVHGRSSDAPGRSAASVTAPVRRATVREFPGARFALVSTQPDEVIRLYDGTITVEASPLANGERLRVLTGDASVEVRGTVFDVTAESDELAGVSVAHGRVEVRVGATAPEQVAQGDHWLRRRNADQAQSAAAREVPTARPGASGLESPAVESAGTVANAARSPEAKPSVETEVPSEAAPGAADPLAARDERGRTPSAGEIAFQQGWAALRSGDPSNAVRLLEGVPLDSSLGPDATFWRGIALARMGRAREAVAVLDSFVLQFPASPHRGEALVALGNVLLGGGNKDAAAARFREALTDARSQVRDTAQRGLLELQRSGGRPEADHSSR